MIKLDRLTPLPALFGAPLLTSPRPKAVERGEGPGLEG